MAVAIQLKPWTIEEMHRLPDDGNKYEVLDGELFVTPAPGEDHELILARLTRLLDPYVARHALGNVLHPRAVVRVDGSELEPDLMVRPARTAPRAKDWDDAPTPLLVVEVLSPTTRRRDVGPKRDFYRRIGVADYWIIDPEESTVRVVRADGEQVANAGGIEWHPAGAAEPLTLPLASIFRD